MQRQDCDVCGGGRMRRWVWMALRGALLALPLAAGAVVPGQTDDFAGPALDGWSSGAGNPNPPVVLAGGGPLGAGDAFLQLAANGGSAGGRLVAFAGPQWTGDFVAAGVTALRMDLRNLGSTDLSLRLMFNDLQGSTAMSTQAVSLVAGSGWVSALFPVWPGALAGNADVLSAVMRMTLLHAPLAVFPPDPVVALLGVDNVTAVPEPGAALLLGAGLVVLMAALRRRPRPGAPWLLAAGLALAGTAQAQDVLPDIQRGGIAVRLQAIATGLSAPAYATFAPGDASRLYVVEQNGLLRVLQNGVLQGGSALDMRGLVAPPLVATNANDERGFLGLAFHPGFATVGSVGYGTLYTYASMAITPGTAPTYAAPNGAAQGYQNVVSEWKMDMGAHTVQAGSRRDLVSFGKNANNHNGGTIAFGPDGYLYLGLGDGGNANDVGPSHLEPGGNAQNLATPLGKMLRIDPVNPLLTAGSANAASANGQYRIPVDNPFQAPGQVAETFAYGLRNPYRFSFDRTDLGGTGDLIAADVGQRTVEEINRVVRGGNYGWAVKEGEFVFYRTDPDGPGPLTAGSVGPRQPGDSGLIDPIQGTLGTLQYDHGDGISITGGFVYRGSAIAQLSGKYVFGDLALRNAPPRVDGRLFYADLQTGVINEFQLPDFANGRLPDGLTVHGFGEDAAGELYALVTNTPANGLGGIVYQITAVPEPSQWALFGVGLVALAGLARRRRAG